MTLPRYLTKSRFKTAYECPRKLYYSEHPETYGNLNLEDEFLKSLAQGGFQVGALAKLYYEGGVDLEGLKSDEAIRRTRDLLERENVVIFEAALQIDRFLIRVDVLEKLGDRINLIEVKAKSYDFPGDENGFFKKRDPGIDGTWEPYLVDVAFQAWVAQKYFGPKRVVTPYLMLADKTSTATVNGLHQRFLIAPAPNGRSTIIVKAGTAKANCGKPILKLAEVKAEVEYLLKEELFPGGLHLPEYAAILAGQLAGNERADIRPSSLCKSCEFRIGTDLKQRGQKSGFDECWIGAGKIKPNELFRPLIFEIWNCKKTEDLLAANKVFMEQVKEEDLKPKSESKGTGMPNYLRQMIQVESVKNKSRKPYIDAAGLREFFKRIRFPIHCIDFETSMSAIPFHLGRRPYEQIAFQFSHHVLREDGLIEHFDQFIHTTPGEFPNFDFVRALKKSLSGDPGTIFRYADHENTVLRQILRQLEATPPDDADELKYFIRQITKPTKKESKTEQPGDRSMVDLKKVIVDYYYHPLMRGSNSIKKVIPAVLEESKLLRERYSNPIYGKGAQIPSLNLAPTVWIELDDNGQVKDPYKQLPPMLSDMDQAILDALDDQLIVEDEKIDDGGAAMTAWARMQFTEMGEIESGAVKQALLKYCELDTLSMVWLIEYFRSLV